MAERAAKCAFSTKMWADRRSIKLQGPDGGQMLVANAPDEKISLAHLSGMLAGTDHFLRHRLAAANCR